MKISKTKYKKAIRKLLSSNYGRGFSYEARWETDDYECVDLTATRETNTVQVIDSSEYLLIDSVIDDLQEGSDSLLIGCQIQMYIRTNVGSDWNVHRPIIYVGKEYVSIYTENWRRGYASINLITGEME